MTMSVPKRTTTIEKITAKDLFVDPDVQRTLRPTRVEEIVAKFNPDALGILAVSRREDGRNHLMDGQHRHAAVIMLDGADWGLECEVYTGLSKSQEALMFRLLNNTRPPTVLEKFKVRVVEGDPVAVEINSILEENGWRLSNTKGDGAFSAVSNTEQVFVRAETAKGSGAGKQMLTWVLEVVNAAFGHDANGVRAEIVVGLSLLWMRHANQVDVAKLVTQLATYNGGPLALISSATTLRDLRGGTTGDAMAERLVALANKGRKVNRLPDWRTEE